MNECLFTDGDHAPALDGADLCPPCEARMEAIRADEARPLHFLGPDLLPPCDDRRPGGYRATPVLADVTCSPCRDFLAHC